MNERDGESARTTIGRMSANRQYDESKCITSIYLEIIKRMSDIGKQATIYKCEGGNESFSVLFQTFKVVNISGEEKRTSSDESLVNASRKMGKHSSVCLFDVYPH
jgi:hypothetical protein